MQEKTNHREGNVLRNLTKKLEWLVPGLGVKRWLILILLGTTLVGLGIAVLILDFYHSAPDGWWVPILAGLSLRFLPRWVRAVTFGGTGFFFILWGIMGLNRALLRPFVSPGKPVLEAVSAYRRKERGPRIVAIGGGNGLSSLLRGLKEHTSNLTAIVTVADDGGSSGELRKNMGVLPPGDIRNCLTALSSDEALMSQIFQYRFGSGAGLNGHSLGNLFITAMAEITGSFEEAIAESARVLAVQGRVLPATLHDVCLAAEIYLPEPEKNVSIKGESSITKAAGKIRRLWLEPDNPPAYPRAIQAILAADLIVIGPGSLYTSVLPNLLVPEIIQAVKASRALKFYVCNVATQPGETDGFSCGDHIRAIEQHVGFRLTDLAVCNKNFSNNLPEHASWVQPEPDLDQEYSLYLADLVDKDSPWRHDSKKVAQVLIDLYYERTGPLASRDEVKNIT